MTERKRFEETGGKRESILSREFVEGVLSIARENLQRDGALKPALFLQFDFGERIVMPLKLPDTTEEKEVYFSTIGSALRKSGKKIQEALTICETWYITKEDADLDVVPSEHPARKEAITMMGRDRQGQQATILLQPFSRDQQNRPIFEPVEIEQFNVSVQTGIQPVGLLDYLFLSPPSHRKKRRLH